MGEEIGPPSDIFSLGAVLTFAATGGGPFGRGSRPELAYRLVYGPPDLGGCPPDCARWSNAAWPRTLASGPPPTRC